MENNYQVDGHENTHGFIIRVHHNPPCVWVYWPSSGKVEPYFATPEQARTAYEALKEVRMREEEKQ